jgi:hypothetical protein
MQISPYFHLNNSPMRNFKLFFFLFLIGSITLGAGIILITVGRTVGQSMFGRGFAEGQVRDYVGAVLRQEINGVRCQAVDTDGNGYVSCDYTVVSQPSTPRSIECAAWGMDGFLNRGCRTRVPTFQ